MKREISWLELFSTYYKSNTRIELKKKKNNTTEGYKIKSKNLPPVLQFHSPGVTNHC